MNQIRIAALNDLKKQIPSAHYLGRPHSIDADLELVRSLLSSPEGLTLREYRAAQALQDWAFLEKRFRVISCTANPARDIDDETPAPRIAFEQEQELTARREVFRCSALVYAQMLGDAQLIECYQTPIPAPATETVPAQTAATPAPVVAVSVSDDVEPDKAGPMWSPKASIQRAPGYRWPLYQFLKAAHIAGQPCPKAREVLDAWALKPPPNVQVMSDDIKYDNGLGKTKEANLRAMQQAIKGLLK